MLESRLLNESIRRRRECLNCTNRFTTYEKAKIHFKVIKRDGKEQEFNLKKIEESVSKACGKTPEEIVLNLYELFDTGYYTIKVTNTGDEYELQIKPKISASN